MDIDTSADLTTDERDAIRSDLAVAVPPHAAAKKPVPRPVALVADDRGTARARPRAMAVARRWRIALERELAGVLLGDRLVVAKTGSIPTATVRDDLVHAFTRRIALDDDGSALLIVSGPLVEKWAERRLGATRCGVSHRPPSPAVLGVFAPVGVSIATAAAAAWSVELGGATSLDPSPDAVARRLRGAGDDAAWVFVDLVVPGDTEGMLRLCAPAPAWLSSSRDSVSDTEASPSCEEVLGPICVPLHVELGRARLSARALQRLRPGAVLHLDRTVGGPLPVLVGGRLKAYGRPVLDGTLIAIEIANDPTTAPGGHS